MGQETWSMCCERNSANNYEDRCDIFYGDYSWEIAVGVDSRTKEQKEYETKTCNIAYGKKHRIELWNTFGHMHDPIQAPLVVVEMSVSSRDEAINCELNDEQKQKLIDKFAEAVMRSKDMVAEPLYSECAYNNMW